MIPKKEKGETSLKIASSGGSFLFFFFEVATKCLCIPSAFSKSCLLSLKIWRALNEKSVPGQVAMKGFGLLELESELCKDSSMQKQRA